MSLQVGVDLSHTSVPLLQRVCGLSAVRAAAIVAHQQTHGRLATRHALLSVPGIGPVTYANIAGFLRVSPPPPGTESNSQSEEHNPLDNTLVHPEKYDLVHKLLKRIGFTKENGKLISEHLFSDKLRSFIGSKDLTQCSQELHVKLSDLTDIVNWLTLEAHNPASEHVRQRGVPPLVTTCDAAAALHGSASAAAVVVGARVVGTVRNVTSFGTFVDLGMKQDGLLHVSEYANKRTEGFVVGQRVDIVIKAVDVSRNRIQLSLPAHAEEIVKLKRCSDNDGSLPPGTALKDSKSRRVG